MTATVLFAGTWEVLYTPGFKTSDRVPSGPIGAVIYPAVTLRGDLIPRSLSEILDPENYTRIGHTLFVPRNAQGYGVTVIYDSEWYEVFVPGNELRPGMAATLRDEPSVFLYERHEPWTAS